MWIRQRWPDFCLRNTRRLQRYALVGIFAVVVLAVALGENPGEEISLSDLDDALLGGALWTLAAMGVGYVLATAMRLPADDRITFVIEFSARNMAVAAIVAISGLGRLDLTLFSGAYVAVGYPLCAGFAIWQGRRRGRDPV
jgi:predicted Na+-dependent transporter